MNIIKLLSRMANESEHSIRVRLNRARGLISQNNYQSNYLYNKEQILTGRIYVITTLRIGKGEEDFKTILRRKRHKITDVLRINWLKYGSRALSQVINNNYARFRSGDIVAIVRGGGNTDDASFSPFNDKDTLKTLKYLTHNKNIILVTGIGHSTDIFSVDNAATFNQATPTDAAYKICELLDHN